MSVDLETCTFRLCDLQRLERACWLTRQDVIALARWNRNAAIILDAYYLPFVQIYYHVQSFDRVGIAILVGVIQSRPHM